MMKRSLAWALLVWGVVATILGFLGLRDIITLYILSINLTACGFVAWDKWMAMMQTWRTPEAVLLGLSFMGGSPGAWVMMQLCRHKTVKTSFRLKFLLITVVQAALIVLLFWLRWN